MHVDSHAHLNFPDFNDDHHEVIQRARNSDIDCIINIGIDLPSNRDSI